MKNKKLIVMLVIQLVMNVTSASIDDINNCRLRKDIAKYGGTTTGLAISSGGIAAVACGIAPASALIPAGTQTAKSCYDKSRQWLLGKRFYQGAEAMFEKNRAGKHYFFYKNTAEKWNKNPTALARELHHRNLGLCNLESIQEAVERLAND